MIQAILISIVPCQYLYQRPSRNQRLVWDGTDRHDARVPAGTYFVEPDAGTSQSWSRVLLVR
ncbi:MAG: hypothetical protein ABIK43_00700 [candidate division WOR-3 bacterium]